MERLELIWTALPASVASSGADTVLSLSVFVSPRLISDSAAATTLAAFPDFLDWPGLVAARLQALRVRIEGGPHFDVVPSPPPAVPGQPSASQLWTMLFRPSSPVHPFVFGDQAGARPGSRFSSPPLPTVIDAIRGLYRLIGSDERHGGGEQFPPVELLARHPLFDAMREAARRRPDRRRPRPDDPDPDTERPRPDDGGRRPPDTERPRRDGDRPRPDPDRPRPPSLAAQTASLTTDPLHDAVTQVVGAWHHVATVSDEVPSSAEALRALYDVHDLVGVLGSHPDFLRRLGLILQVDVPVPASAMPLPAASSVQVMPLWSAPPPKIRSHAPLTAYGLDSTRFFARPRPEAPQIVAGLLQLDVPDRFRVEQVDIEGATEKLYSLTGMLDHFGAARGRSGDIGITEEVSLPALRSGTMSVLHQDRVHASAGSGHLVENGAASDMRVSVSRGVDLNAQLAAAGEGPTADDDVTPPPIGPMFAEDLTAGLRVDVRDGTTGAWHSLCQRSSKYTVLPPGGKGGKSSEAVNVGEGFLESVAGGSNDDLTVPAAVLSWDGWSLCAPRPGKVLDAKPSGEDGLIEPKNDAATAFGLTIMSTATPGSLPRLRFGRPYRFRARAVDITGQSLSLDQLPGGSVSGASSELVYRRFEPVSSPLVLSAVDPLPGESVARLVVRSDPTTGVVQTPMCERLIAPPKVAQVLTELHGKFDNPDGKVAADKYELAKREKGAFNELTKLESGELELSADHSAVPYLPDPMARGALFVGLPGKQFVRVPYTGSWPDLAPFRIRLVAGGLAFSSVPKFDEKTRVLTVRLPAGASVTVRLSSTIVLAPSSGGTEDAEGLELLDGMAVWHWIKDAKPSNLATLEARARAGRFWLLMPWQELVLTHAVQRPIQAPKLTKPKVSGRQVGDTSAPLSCTATVHAASTDKVDVLARWVDEVDDPSVPDGPMPVESRAHVGEAETEVTKVESLRHEFGDTRVHHVRYRAQATSRFREYFLDHPGATLTRDSPDADVVVVKSSARPAAPVVHSVLPTFVWERSRKRKGKIIYTATRRGRGLRVWLERPWNSSGNGEMLGVVLYTFKTSMKTDPRFALSTHWSLDPIWKALPERFPPAPSTASFDLDVAVVESGLTLPGLPDAKTVSVAAFLPTYDTARKQWFCDIEFSDDLKDAYFPFVRLALARYQPASIKKKVKLSAVTVCDYVQLAPDRTVTVSVMTPDPKSKRLRRNVKVEGVFADVLEGQGGTAIEAWTVRPGSTGFDLDWVRDGDPVQLKEVTAAKGGVARTTFVGEVSFPSTGIHRLVVQEREFRVPNFKP